MVPAARSSRPLGEVTGATSVEPGVSPSTLKVEKKCAVAGSTSNEPSACNSAVIGSALIDARSKIVELSQKNSTQSSNVIGAAVTDARLMLISQGGSLHTETDRVPEAREPPSWP